jgi:hypothetical protein
MNNKRLYIIGNGFDIYHKMDTRYADFHKYLSENNADLVDFLESYCYMEFDKAHLWTNFELDLGTFAWEDFFKENDNAGPLQDCESIGSYSGVFDDINEQLENKTEDINSAFYGWIIETEDNYYSKLQNISLLDIDRDALYLTFNYTDTLNKIYKIPDSNILHIHKSIKAQPDKLIFGHNKSVELEGNNPDSFLGDYTRALDVAKLLFFTLKKDTHKIIQDNIAFFNNLKNISEIIILGHSINEIDLPYYEKIYHVVNQSTLWRVSYHCPKDENKYKQILISIGIDENRIEMFKMQELSKAGKR